MLRASATSKASTAASSPASTTSSITAASTHALASALTSFAASHSRIPVRVLDAEHPVMATSNTRGFNALMSLSSPDSRAVLETHTERLRDAERAVSSDLTRLDHALHASHSAAVSHSTLGVPPGRRRLSFSAAEAHPAGDAYGAPPPRAAPSAPTSRAESIAAEASRVAARFNGTRGMLYGRDAASAPIAAAVRDAMMDVNNMPPAPRAVAASVSSQRPPASAGRFMQGTQSSRAHAHAATPPTQRGASAAAATSSTSSGTGKAPRADSRSRGRSTSATRRPALPQLPASAPRSGVTASTAISSPSASTVTALPSAAEIADDVLTTLMQRLHAHADAHATPSTTGSNSSEHMDEQQTQQAASTAVAPSSTHSAASGTQDGLIQSSVSIDTSILRWRMYKRGLAQLHTDEEGRTLRVPPRTPPSPPAAATLPVVTEHAHASLHAATVARYGEDAVAAAAIVAATRARMLAHSPVLIHESDDGSAHEDDPEYSSEPAWSPWCPIQWRLVMDAYVDAQPRARVRQLSRFAHIFHVWRRHASSTRYLRSAAVAVSQSAHIRRALTHLRAWYNCALVCVTHKRFVATAAMRAWKAYVVPARVRTSAKRLADSYFRARACVAAVARWHDIATINRIPRILAARAMKFRHVHARRAAVLMWRFNATRFRLERTQTALAVQHATLRVTARIMRAWRRRARASACNRAFKRTMSVTAAQACMRAWMAYTHNAKVKHARALRAAITYRTRVCTTHLRVWHASMVSAALEQRADAYNRSLAAGRGFTSWRRALVRKHAIALAGEVTRARVGHRAILHAVAHWHACARLHACANAVLISGAQRRLHHAFACWLELARTLMHDKQMDADADAQYSVHACMRALRAWRQRVATASRARYAPVVAISLCKRRTLLAWKRVIETTVSRREREAACTRALIRHNRARTLLTHLTGWCIAFEAKRLDADLTARLHAVIRSNTCVRVFHALREAQARATMMSDAADVLAMHTELSRAGGMLRRLHRFMHRGDAFAAARLRARAVKAVRAWFSHTSETLMRAAQHATAVRAHAKRLITSTWDAWVQFRLMRRAVRGMNVALDTFAARHAAARYVLRWRLSLRIRALRHSRDIAADAWFARLLVRRHMRAWAVMCVRKAAITAKRRALGGRPSLARNNNTTARTHVPSRAPPRAPAAAAPAAAQLPLAPRTNVNSSTAPTPSNAPHTDTFTSALASVVRAAAEAPKPPFHAADAKQLFQALDAATASTRSSPPAPAAFPFHRARPVSSPTGMPAAALASAGVVSPASVRAAARSDALTLFDLAGDAPSSARMAMSPEYAPNASLASRTRFVPLSPGDDDHPPAHAQEGVTHARHAVGSRAQVGVGARGSPRTRVTAHVQDALMRALNDALPAGDGDVAALSAMIMSALQAKE